MKRTERIKTIKQWRGESPKRYQLYQMMIKLYRDDENKERYSNEESIQFIMTLNEKEAQEVINKTLENK